LEKIPSFTYEKEVLSRHGLTIVTMDMPGFVHVKIFEGDKEITEWLKPSYFMGWVQGFVYAVRRQETSVRTDRT
jgi:hypothetical protein